MSKSLQKECLFQIIDHLPLTEKREIVSKINRDHPRIVFTLVQFNTWLSLASIIGEVDGYLEEIPLKVWNVLQHSEHLIHIFGIWFCHYIYQKIHFSTEDSSFHIPMKEGGKEGDKEGDKEKEKEDIEWNDDILFQVFFWKDILPNPEKYPVKYIIDQYLDYIQKYILDHSLLNWSKYLEKGCLYLLGKYSDMYSWDYIIGMLDIIHTGHLIKYIPMDASSVATTLLPLLNKKGL